MANYSMIFTCCLPTWWNGRWLCLLECTIFPFSVWTRPWHFSWVVYCVQRQ